MVMTVGVVGFDADGHLDIVTDLRGPDIKLYGLPWGWPGWLDPSATADKAAKSCVRAIHARKREHVFTAHGKVAAFLGRHTPSLLHLAATRS